MPLLAWEEMRLPTVNKIFIRRTDLTMGRNVMVKGVFMVRCQRCYGEVGSSRRFYSWSKAYHAFRFMSSFLGYDWVSIEYYAPHQSARHIVSWLIMPFGFRVRWFEGKWESLDQSSPNYPFHHYENGFVDVPDYVFGNEGYLFDGFQGDLDDDLELMPWLEHMSLGCHDLDPLFDFE